MSKEFTQEEQKLIEEVNAPKEKHYPGQAINKALDSAKQRIAESQEIQAMMHTHSGREYLVTEAYREAYTELMGDKPEEINGRTYSQHAIAKSLELINNHSGHFKDAMDEGIKLRKDIQDSIDDSLRQLEMLPVPESPEDLDKALDYIANEFGTQNRIKKALNDKVVASELSKLGLLEQVQRKSTAQIEAEDQRKIAILKKGQGVSLIQAGLMENS